MNCKQAKAEIALWVGGDLSGSAEARLHQHLSDCSECREYRKRLKSSLRVLQNPAESPVPIRSRSVWPDLASRLPVREKMWSRSRFNGWVPATLIAASCVVILYSAFRSPLTVQTTEIPVVEPVPVLESPQSRLLRPSPVQEGSPVDETLRLFPRQEQKGTINRNPFPPHRPLFLVPREPGN